MRLFKDSSTGNGARARARTRRRGGHAQWWGGWGRGRGAVGEARAVEMWHARVRGRGAGRAVRTAQSGLCVGGRARSRALGRRGARRGASRALQGDIEVLCRARWNALPRVPLPSVPGPTAPFPEAYQKPGEFEKVRRVRRAAGLGNGPGPAPRDVCQKTRPFCRGPHWREQSQAAWSRSGTRGRRRSRARLRP